MPDTYDIQSSVMFCENELPLYTFQKAREHQGLMSFLGLSFTDSACEHLPPEK